MSGSRRHRSRWNSPRSVENIPRPPNQFPSKYSQLPGIQSPEPYHDNQLQLVPLKGSEGRRSEGGRGRSSGMESGDAEERMRQLEVRLNVSEKSNRALLEEVLRLQNDLRVTSQKSEEIILEEQEARLQLEGAMKLSNDLISQLSSRIKETEDKIIQEKATLSSLLNHTKGVEHAVLSSQQELHSKKDAQGNQIQDLRAELADAIQAKNQLERVSYQLSDELRTLKTKMDTQNAEFQTSVNELKNKSKRLEDDNRLQLDTLRKQSDVQSHTDVQTTHLRGQVENRLSELRDVLVDLRTKQEGETSDRRALEHQIQTRVNELFQGLAELNRKREESVHQTEMTMREKEHVAHNDRLALTSKVADTVEELNKKLLQKEIKIREELQSRFLQLEKLIQQEQQARMEHERSVRDDADKKWQSARSAQAEELHSLRESIKNEKLKNKEAFKKLDDGTNILDKQLQENKKQADKLMAADIQSRKQHEKRINDQIASVNEKLQIATSTLQQAIGGVNSQVEKQQEKMKKEVQALMNEQQAATTRAMADLDARLFNLKQKVSQIEDMLEARVAAASATLSQNLRDRMESISAWQDTTGQTLQELSTNVKDLPQEVYILQEKNKLMKNEMESRVTAEADARMRDIENLKQEVSSLKNRHDPQAATVQDIETVQSSMRKLADSIQTVKTVLGMKIQSEQKLRTEEMRNMQEELTRLRKAIEGLTNKPLPRTFVKDPSKGRKEAEDSAQEVNKWGVYNAYRWLKWKSRLMYLRWQIKAENNPSPITGRSNQSPRQSQTDRDNKPTSPDKDPNRPASRKEGQSPANKGQNSRPNSKQGQNSRPTSKQGQNSRPNSKQGQNSRPASNRSKTGQQTNPDPNDTTW